MKWKQSLSIASIITLLPYCASVLVIKRDCVLRDLIDASRTRHGAPVTHPSVLTHPIVDRWRSPRSDPPDRLQRRQLYGEVAQVVLTESAGELVDS